jgi:hypothetical protein
VTDAVGHWLNAAGRVPLLSAAEEVHLSQSIRRWQDWEGGPDAAPAQVQRYGWRRGPQWRLARWGNGKAAAAGWAWLRAVASGITAG